MPFWRSVVEREVRGVKVDVRKTDYVYKDTYQQPDRYQEVRSACRGLTPAEKLNEPLFSFSGYEQNRFFYNTGGGRFEELGGALGLGRLEDGRSFVRFDMDRDGDEDLFLWNFRRGTMVLLRNEIGQDRKFVGVQLRGKAPNRFAVGAKVTLRCGGLIAARAVGCGEGYLSCHPPEVLLGAGDAETADLEILWPSGTRQRFEKTPTGAWYAAEEGRPTLERRTFAPDAPAAAAPAPARRHSEGETFAGKGVILALATVEELEELEPLKAGGGTLRVSPPDREAMERAAASAPGWTVEADGAAFLGDAPLLPCVLVVEAGRVKAKFAGPGCGARAARWRKSAESR